MKLLAFTFLILFHLSSCKKDIIGNFRIPNGTWYSQNPQLQFTILRPFNPEAKIKFTEFENDGKHFLKIDHPIGSELYIVVWIGRNEMVLTHTKDPTNAKIYLSKIE